MIAELAHGVAGTTLDWRPHLDVWLTMLTLEGSYLLAIRKWGPAHVSPGDAPVPRSKIALFTLGVLTLWLFADWPIHELSEDHLFSVHMVQHMAFSFAGVPLMLMGMPDWMIRGIIRPRAVHALLRFLTRPVVALIVFNGYLVLSHWPAFVNRTVSSDPLHALAHVVLVGTSFIMWWPVLSPLPELPRLSHPGQMLYLFLQTVVPTVPASFLTFAETPLYSAYESAPRILGLSALVDQQVAGLIMKLGGGFFLWTVIAVLFFRWSSREESGTPDAVDWQDIELRLNQPKVTER